jgi:5-methylcytosine-specific restriction enzyme A
VKRLYDSARWKRRRAAQLRSEPFCRLCEDRGRVTEATVADHIEPHRGDPVKFDGPLQSLCASCHSAIKQSQEQTGHIRGHDRAGNPLDRSHPWNRGGEVQGPDEPAPTTVSRDIFFQSQLVGPPGRARELMQEVCRRME